ncbi:MAG: GntR family transcriptional regulator [Deltaproteobacteria bacterium]
MTGKIRLNIRNPISIREKVYSTLRNDILNAKIQPGSRMVETKLANQIKTSRTPVREALHMLEMEGLLESIPRVGYRVKQIKWEELEEITQIRVVNETLAAQWALKRITPKEIGALEQNISDAEDDLNSGNPRSFVQHDAEFHEIFVRASGSERLLELCQLLRRHMLRYRIESLYLPEVVSGAIVGHKKIVTCIKSEDGRGIEKAICDHLEKSKEEIRRHAFGKGNQLSVTPGKSIG